MRVLSASDSYPVGVRQVMVIGEFIMVLIIWQDFNSLIGCNILEPIIRARPQPGQIVPHGVIFGCRIEGVSPRAALSQRTTINPGRKASF